VDSLRDVQVRLGFDAHVAALRSAGRDFGESRLLACPGCGHANPDHRWSAPFDCLEVPCECPGFGPLDVADDLVDAAFDAAWGEVA
jgi:hypothetical protein